MTAWRSFLDQGLMGGRMLAGLPRFLRQCPTSGQSRAALQRQLRDRGRVFLELLRRAVYEHPASPYLPLLRHARISHADCVRLVESHGVEGALERLYDAGVRVTLDEFKGRRPISRGSLSIPTTTASFDNPLSAKHFELSTGGSRTAGSRFIVDLELIAHDGHYDQIFFDMLGLQSRPGALWHPGPPGSAGLKWALRSARMGHRLERWFSQTPVSFARDPRNTAFMRGIVLVSGWCGHPVPMPEHAGLSDALVVARWLANRCAKGEPAWLSTTASSAVRLCLAARDHGLDIRGTFIRTSGEPLSPAKARVIADAGVVGRCHYAMAEIGRMGMACGRPSTFDDVHIVADKVAFLQRQIELAGGATVPALVLTTLLWSVPKVMLNVELGDYAVRNERACGCAWETLGFTAQLHTIRSYEKLTSEGMHFVGADLLVLVEEVLPRRFGGDPTDYQFVEEELNGLPVVSLLVSLRVGPLEAAQVQTAVLDALASRDAANRMMAGLWRDGGTLRVVRREPYTTSAGKILALHVSRNAPV